MIHAVVTMERKAAVARDCRLCLPDWRCQAIGKEGLPDARILQVAKNGRAGILWRRIEECATRCVILGGDNGN